MIPLSVTTSHSKTILVTGHDGAQKPRAGEHLVLGHYAPAKQTLLARKAGQRPFVLSIDDLLQHVVVYAQWLRRGSWTMPISPF